MSRSVSVRDSLAFNGGAEYLTDKYIVCPNGSKEGIFEDAKYIVRIDGDITKDAELSVKEEVKA